MIECTKLATFDQHLNTLYGRFVSAPFQAKAHAFAKAISKPCGPFPALFVEASNIISRRPAISSDTSGNVFLLLLLEGETVVQHYGKSVALNRGDVVIIDSCSPLEIAAPGHTQSCSIAIERSELLSLPRSPEQVFGTKISGTKGFPNLLAGMLQALVSDDHEYDNRERQVVTQSILSIVDQHFAQNDMAADHMHQQRHLLRDIKKWLIDNMHEPELDVTNVTQQFHVSRSTIYRLFGSTGVSPRNWIIDQRLNAAHDAITDPNQKHLSISTICFQAGFNDAAHFSRLFRQKFGGAPRMIRNTALMCPPSGARISAANGDHPR